MHLVPTLNRISKLTEFMKSAVCTGTSTPGLVIVDKDDYLANQDDYLRLEAEAFPIGWKLNITKARGMGDKVRESWGLVKGRAWVSIMNDDHKFITPQWDVKLINQLNGKNIISCSDGLHCPPRIGGCTLFSMPLLECLGYPIFPPQINHLGIDDVYELIGRATGCWRVDTEVIVEHRHIFRGAANDKTHTMTYGEVPWEGSPAQIDATARLELFKGLELKGAIDRVKAFTWDEKHISKAI